MAGSGSNLVKPFQGFFALLGFRVDTSVGISPSQRNGFGILGTGYPLNCGMMMPIALIVFLMVVLMMMPLVCSVGVHHAESHSRRDGSAQLATLPLSRRVQKVVHF
jgi:uncharacterized membrane protein